MAHDFGPLQPVRLTGTEPFHNNGHPCDFRMLDFWQWSQSDLVSNVTRGVLAEFLVASSLNIATGTRTEWAAFDLEWRDIRIEVKSAAYIQSWHQSRLSDVIFRVPKTRAWDPQTNQMEDKMQRPADVYVFAVLAHQNKSTIDPMNLTQWEFYVLPTIALNQRTRSQHSITLATLRRLKECVFVTFDGIPDAIQQTAGK